MTDSDAGRIRIRELRKARGWTQRDLADQVARLAWIRKEERVGITGDMVAKWERGEKRPVRLYRELLCLVFGVSVDELGLGQGNPADADGAVTASSTMDSSVLALMDGATAVLEQLGEAGAILQPRMFETWKDELMQRRALLKLIGLTPAATALPFAPVRSHRPAQPRPQAHPGDGRRPGAARHPLPEPLPHHRPGSAHDARDRPPGHRRRPTAPGPGTGRTPPAAGQPLTGRHPRRPAGVLRPARPDDRPRLLQRRPRISPRRRRPPPGRRRPRTRRVHPRRRTRTVRRPGLPTRRRPPRHQTATRPTRLLAGRRRVRDPDQRRHPSRRPRRRRPRPRRPRPPRPVTRAALVRLLRHHPAGRVRRLRDPACRPPG